MKEFSAPTLLAHALELNLDFDLAFLQLFKYELLSPSNLEKKDQEHGKGGWARNSFTSYCCNSPAAMNFGISKINWQCLMGNFLKFASIKK